MHFFKILLSIILMALAVSVDAQKSNALLLKWNVLDSLPAMPGQVRSLGYAGPVTGVHNNVLLVAGGANFPGAMPWQGGVKKYYQQGYIYQKKNDALQLLEITFLLPFSVAYSANCSTPEGVFFAGGENENGVSNKTGLMLWDAATKQVVFKKLPVLPIAVSNAAAANVGNKIYVAGGETSTVTSSQFLSLDLQDTAAGWKKLSNIPHPVSHGVIAALRGKSSSQIVIIGGRKKNANGISDLYNNVFSYDVKKDCWVEKSPLPYGLAAGTGVAFNDENIIVFGGDKGVVFTKTEKLIAAIQEEKDTIRKQELIAQKSEVQNGHPGFSKEILKYNIKKDKWETNGEIPYNTPVTTTAVKWNSLIIIPSGEIKAGVRSADILSVQIVRKNK